MRVQRGVYRLQGSANLGFPPRATCVGQTVFPIDELTITHNFCELRERPKGQVVDKVDNKKGVADDTL